MNASPRRAGRLRPWSATGALLAAHIGGCSLVSDLGRFEQEGAGAGGTGGGMDAGGTGDAGVDSGSSDAGGDDLGCTNPRTLCVRLRQFAPHVDQLVGIDLVSEDNNLRARALLDPLNDGPATADIVMPLAIPETEVPEGDEPHPLHLEIFGDQNEDGEYTPAPDHDWDVELPASGNVVFTHNTVFNDLLPRPNGIGGDFHMTLTGMNVHAGQMLEVMVIEDLSNRTVGLYRLQAVPDSGNVDITIPGIIDVGGVGYRVEFYADANDNRTYDDPTADHAWLILGESNDTGLELDFEHGTNFTPLEYQFDFEE